MTTFRYRLPVSVVDLDVTLATGIRRTKQRAEVAIERAVKASVAATADPRQEAFITADFDPSLVEDGSLKLSFAEDLRLSSVGAETKGQAASIVSSVTQILTTVAGAVTPRALMELGLDSETAENSVPKAGRKTAPDTAYQDAFQDRAQRRRELASTVDGLVGKLNDTATALSRETDPAKAKSLAEWVDGLKKTLDSVRSSFDELDEHYRAWLAATYEKSRVIKNRVRVDAMDLIPDETPPDEMEPERAPKAWPSGSWFPRTGLALLILDPWRPNLAATTVEGASVHFREQRGVKICIYGSKKAPEPDQPADVRPTEAYELLQVIPASIVDRYSTLVTFPLEGGLFDHRTLLVESTGSGGLAKIEVSSTSFLQAVASALAGIPGTVATSLESMSKTQTAASDIRQANVSARIAELENRKKLIEAEIAFSDAAAGRRASQELLLLERQINLLKKREELEDLE